ncbi:MAG: phosphate ABC transporter substrate-binding protein [Phycisphaerales bacterium]|nr:MAG: phosphate ABC transporter substrate-binding protein [Phycisphaerales bacterium]
MARLGLARVLGVCGAVVCALALSVSAGEPRVDETLPAYRSSTGVSGTVMSIGSDTMNNLMAAWGDEFVRVYPGVRVEIDGKGSATAPPALAQGQAQFGPMSRRMRPSEIDAFRRVYGYEPTLMRTGIDTLAVFVHKDCPLDVITLEQVERVFSVNGPSMTWGDLGVTDADWSGRPVSLYGRNSASGTYSYFKQVALGNHDFKATVKEQPGSSSVVQAVGTDLYGMGYSGLGYTTSGVKALSIDAGYGAFEPTYENALTADYPIARFLYVYVNKDPREEMDPLRREFIKLIFSRDGQDAVIRHGYFPLPADVAREELQNVGIEPGF